MHTLIRHYSNKYQRLCNNCICLSSSRTQTASLTNADPDRLITTSLMPKALETPTSPHPLCQGTNPWLRVCRLAGLPFREDQSAEKWAASEEVLLSIVLPIISSLGDTHRTKMYSTTLALQHHFLNLPRHADRLPQTTSSPRGPLRLVLGGPSQEPPSRSIHHDQQSRASTSTSLPTCLLHACTLLSKSGQSACARPCHLRGSWTAAALAAH